MDEWIELRRKIRNQKIPLRQLARDTGIYRTTLRKIRDNGQPPGYQRTTAISQPKISPYLDRIKAILEDDKGAGHKKQYKHTNHKDCFPWAEILWCFQSHLLVLSYSFSTLPAGLVFLSKSFLYRKPRSAI